MRVVLDIADGAAVNKKVNRSKLIARLAHQLFDLLRAGDVATNANRPPARGFNGADDLPGVLLARGIADCDVSAFGGEPQGGGPSDAARAAGDERDTIAELRRHFCASCRLTSDMPRERQVCIS